MCRLADLDHTHQVGAGLRPVAIGVHDDHVVPRVQIPVQLAVVDTRLDAGIIVQLVLAEAKTRKGRWGGKPSGIQGWG